MSNVKQDILWRATFCLGIVVVFAIWIAFSMFKIQVVEGDKWLNLSDSMHIKHQDIGAARGNIYSANGSLLATSMPIYEIRWDATVPKDDVFNAGVSDLAIAMNKMFPERTASSYRASLERARRSKNRYMLIRRKVNYHQQKEIRKWPIFKLGRFKGGFISQLTTKRVRPAGLLAYRTIGYRTESNPGVGLERSYEEELGGTSGKRLVQRISGGYRPLNDENLLEPENGKDIYTTINVDFQEITQRALSATLDRTDADHGCAVVMEVATGKIKAISNLKNLGDGGFREEYNYAVGEIYEAGSVWKVFSAMAALEDDLVDLGDSLKLMGGKRDFSGEIMLDSEQPTKKYETFKDAFSKSSNVVLSSVIYDNYKSKPASYISHLKKLDLHEKTGIEILGEGEPYINQPSSNKWSPVSLPWLAIGYENQHTPLQLLTAYNGVINKGKLVAPMLVEKITDAGIVVQDNTSKIKSKRVCSRSTSDKIREMTSAVFVNGTGRRSKSSVVSLAGKTGTAQIARGGSYGAEGARKQYNASFVGHFPAEDPVYSVFIMVNKPKNQFYASTVAVPAFKEIAEKIFTISVKEKLDSTSQSSYPVYTTGYYKDIEALNKTVGYAMPSEVNSEVVAVNAAKNKVSGVKVAPGKMPDTRGMGARDVIYLLENLGLKVVLKGRGSVVEQSPPPGTKIEPNRRVYIRLET